MTSRLLNVEPPELRFTYELNKQATCILRLSNHCHYPVAFKVMTTDPEKYAVRPNIGVVDSLSACDVQVIMLAPNYFMPDMMQCKDEFLIKSVIASPWTTTEDARQLFKEPQRSVAEFKVTVIYIYTSAASNQQRLPAMQVEGENGVHYGDLIKKIFNFVLGVFVVWFLMKMLPTIWSWTIAIAIAMVKIYFPKVVQITKKMFLDSAEEWILKSICYVFVQYIWGNLRNIGELLKLLRGKLLRLMG